MSKTHFSNVNHMGNSMKYYSVDYRPGGEDESVFQAVVEDYGGAEASEFLKCTEVKNWKESAFLAACPETDLELTDVLWTVSVCVPVVSHRLMIELESNFKLGLQFLPIDVRNSKAKSVGLYHVVNVLNEVDAIDYVHSNLVYAMGSSTRVNYARKLVLRKDAFDSTSPHIFRLANYRFGLIVSSSVKCLFEKRGYKGWGFEVVKVV